MPRMEMKCNPRRYYHGSALGEAPVLPSYYFELMQARLVYSFAAICLQTLCKGDDAPLGEGHFH